MKNLIERENGIYVLGIAKKNKKFTIERVLLYFKIFSTMIHPFDPI